jgi:transposase
MQVIIERCAGLDVHQETVVACVLAGTPGQRPTKEIRTFCTMTRDLEALRDWLKAAGVTHVGMESTGVYWRPVYAVLVGHRRSADPPWMKRVGGRSGVARPWVF